MFVWTAWNFCDKILEIALKLLPVLLILTHKKLVPMNHLFIFYQIFSICYTLDRYPKNNSIYCKIIYVSKCVI